MGTAASAQASRKPVLNDGIIPDAQRMETMDVTALAAVSLPAPPATPPTKRKSDICTPSELDVLDTAVAQQDAMELVRLSTHALALRLLSIVNGSNDVTRLRALFTWLVNVDIDKLANEAVTAEETTNSVHSYLRKIQRRQGNYAHMMAALCNCSGIPVRVVTGVAKSATYRLGKPIDRATSAAQWNAVHVAGEWHLLDCRWARASRERTSGSGGANDDWQLMSIDGQTARPSAAAAAAAAAPPAAGKSTELAQLRSANDFFFLPEPAELGTTHFPNETAWQLLTKSLSWTDFERGAYVRQRFFQLGASFGRPELARSCQVPLRDDGSAIVELVIGAADSPSVTFKYVLSRARADPSVKGAATVTGSEVGVDIRRRVFFERDGKTIRYTVRLPEKGAYKFDVYGRDSRLHDAHDLMCSYLITSESVDAAEPHALPDEPEIGWGPGASCEAFGIIAMSHRSGRIDLPDASTGELDVVFKLPQHPLELRHTLLTSGGDDDGDTVTARASAQSVLVVHGGVATISLRIARPGAYALKLFAGEERVPAELQNVCNYLVTRRAPSRLTASVARGFPLLVDGHLGVTSYARELHVEPAPPERHPIIVAGGKDNCVDLAFVCGEDGPPLALLALANGALPLSDGASAAVGSLRGRCAVRQASSDRRVVLKVDASGQSEMLVRVFARLSDDPLRVYNVYNCLVRSQQDKAGAAALMRVSGSGANSSAAVARASTAISGSQYSIGLPPDCEAPVVELTTARRYLPPAAHQVALTAAASKPDGETRVPGAVTCQLVESGKYNVTVFAIDGDGGGNLRTLMCLSVISAGQSGGHGHRAEGAHAARDSDDDEDEVADEDAGTSASTETEDAINAAAIAKKLAARNALNAALADRHLVEIQNALADYLACGGQATEKLVKVARRTAAILQAAEALQAAIEANSAKLLLDALTQARAANSRGELSAAMKMAERKLAQLQLAVQLSDTVTNLDQRTMSEMRAYAHPPEAVFLVAKATLLLLGTDSADIQDWRQVQAWLGKTGAESVKRRVLLFNYRTIPLAQTDLPKRIFDQFTPAEVRAVSAGASAFFSWGSGMIGLIEQVAADLHEKETASGVPAASSG